MTVYYTSVVLKFGSPTGSGSGEGPGGDDKCGKTGHQSGSCLHLPLFFGFGGLGTRVALNPYEVIFFFL